ncbi:MAG TPA: hypothetical protein VL832_26445 [Puia sp.]|jgi:hypothetical protein|nr:hypothetical protein [Puia sp.]
MENTESLGDTLLDLKKRGYGADLNFETNTFALYGGDLDMRLNPEGFHVDEIDHACDEAHPNDGAVVYAITSATGVKGVVVDAQGT